MVGVYLAFYSERKSTAGRSDFCNLAAWCVLDEYRSHRSAAAQRAAGTERLPFHRSVAERKRNTAQHPAQVFPPGRGDCAGSQPAVAVCGRRKSASSPSRKEIERTLRGRDLEIYRDHARAAAARHVVVVKGDEPCYVMFRRDRRKNLPLFASILYVGNPELFRMTLPSMSSAICCFATGFLRRWRNCAWSAIGPSLRSC